MFTLLRGSALLGLVIAIIIGFAVNIVAGVIALVVYGVIFYLGFPQLIHILGVHPHYKGREFNLPGKKALIIGTNHDTLGDTGNKTGVALS